MTSIITAKDLENLNHMGKAWFVLRYYSEHIDSTETRYKNCTKESLATRRETNYQATKAVHAELLLEVLTSGRKIGLNKLGVSYKEVIDMAKKSILALM